MADIETAKQTFARYDADNDGFITAAEYSKAMAELGDPYVTETVAQALINKADTSKDGVLSFDEFWAAQNV
ncbi:Ca2+-binding EF-hand superfamily protein [Kitasatospora gansuensis]|uniref:Ca2+-binding EF-hand superfamily protein n=1 Tax=Kitasatospora gansuensis TaxID=258050 RepID=A0A7W7S839_9ACTN|nr:EF-hand domain-containing protein [Kitasatospora gansuensis]MBB4944651.1 Ca2+-binding EF-hand superfamily protein [Kitasatospora gansuensis]